MTLRHYWNPQRSVCDCGSRKRIWLNGWVCAAKVCEIMEEEGYDCKELKK